MPFLFVHFPINTNNLMAFFRHPFVKSRHGAPHGLTINPSRSHMGHTWVIYGPHMGHIGSTYGSYRVHIWVIHGPQMCHATYYVIIQCCIWLFAFFLAITLRPISARSCFFMSMHEHIF